MTTKVQHKKPYSEPIKTGGAHENERIMPFFFLHHVHRVNSWILLHERQLLLPRGWLLPTFRLSEHHIVLTTKVFLLTLWCLTALSDWNAATRKVIIVIVGPTDGASRWRKIFSLRLLVSSEYVKASAMSEVSGCRVARLQDDWEHWEW